MSKIKAYIEELIDSDTYTNVKTDLIAQLQEKEDDTDSFKNLVEDYMSLWITKSLLIKDIQDNGINMVYNNGGGQSGVKANPSVKQLLQVNQQMLRILDKLKINAKKGKDSEIEDEDWEL